MSTPKKITVLAGLILTLIAIGLNPVSAITAAGPKPQEEPPLRVVTKPIEPFVIKEQERLTGFSIDLWKEIALLAELSFEFIEVETVADQLDSIAGGQADIAIAAISMTPEREERFDFSYPYYRSGLQIMVINEPRSTLTLLLAFIVSPAFLTTSAALLLILIVVGHIVWLLERKSNLDFPRSYWPGIWEGLWWSAVTVTTVGYGDKTVKDVPGRILGMIWMFAGLFLIANFTALVTAELTASTLSSSIDGPDDLPGKRVATVVGTTSAAWLQAEGLSFRGVEAIDDAYRLLKNGLVDAVVYDAPVLQYYVLTNQEEQLITVGTPFKREDYGIALPQNSPYEEQINRALLEILINGTYKDIEKRWFGAEISQ